MMTANGDGKMDAPRGIAAEVAQPADNCARFVIDAKRSRFAVQAFATGMLSMMGHNPIIGIRRYRGEMVFAPETAEASRLRLVIESASFSVEDDISEKDRREMERLMKEEVLEVEKYPEIRYDASPIDFTKMDSGLYLAAMNGELSFHGVTRKQRFSARISALGEMLRASGNFTVKQSDYQLKPISVAGGALKLKDELRFTFEIVAHRQHHEV
jgi:polyisoprenoid-binding protein YceI